MIDYEKTAIGNRINSTYREIIEDRLIELGLTKDIKKLTELELYDVFKSSVFNFEKKNSDIIQFKGMTILKIRSINKTIDLGSQYGFPIEPICFFQVTKKEIPKDYEIENAIEYYNEMIEDMVMEKSLIEQKI